VTQAIPTQLTGAQGAIQTDVAAVKADTGAIRTIVVALPGQITAAQTAIQTDVASARTALSGQIGGVQTTADAIKAETDKISTQVIPKIDGVQAYLADPTAGLPKLLGDVGTANDQLKAQRKGRLLNRETAVELGETISIRYLPAATGAMPALRIYGPAGFSGVGPAAMTDADGDGVFEFSQLFDAALPLGEYTVIVAEPSSAVSNGTLDHLTLKLQRPLATSAELALAEGNLSAQLTGAQTAIQTDIAGAETALSAQLSGTETTILGGVSAAEANLSAQLASAQGAIQTDIAGAQTALGTQLTGAQTAIQTDVAASQTALSTQLSGAQTALGTQIGRVQTTADAIRAEMATSTGTIIASLNDLNTQLTQVEANLDTHLTAIEAAMATRQQVDGVMAGVNQLIAKWDTLDAQTLMTALNSIDAAVGGSAVAQDIAMIRAEMAKETTLQQVQADVLATGGQAPAPVATAAPVPAPAPDVTGQLSSLEASQALQADTLLSELSKLRLALQKSAPAAEAGTAAESAYMAAREAVEILRDLRAEVRQQGGGAPAAMTLLLQLREQLAHVSSGIPTAQEAPSGKEINDQLTQIADQMRSFSSTKGYHFDSLYEMSESQGGDVKTVRNHVEELKALLDVQRSILERGVNQPMVKTWFEAR